MVELEAQRVAVEEGYAALIDLFRGEVDRTRELLGQVPLLIKEATKFRSEIGELVEQSEEDQTKIGAISGCLASRPERYLQDWIKMDESFRRTTEEMVSDLDQWYANMRERMAWLEASQNELERRLG